MSASTLSFSRNSGTASSPPRPSSSTRTPASHSPNSPVEPSQAGPRRRSPTRSTSSGERCRSSGCNALPPLLLGRLLRRRPSHQQQQPRVRSSTAVRRWYPREPSRRPREAWERGRSRTRTRLGRVRSCRSSSGRGSRGSIEGSSRTCSRSRRRWELASSEFRPASFSRLHPLDSMEKLTIRRHAALLCSTYETVLGLLHGS
jgi:hypothetical protein